MTDGERMVWAATFASQWQREAEIATKRGEWVPRNAARSCALTAATAVESMRAAHRLGPVDIDGDAFAMLDIMTYSSREEGT